jgi:hypothetical protein
MGCRTVIRLGIAATVSALAAWVFRHGVLRALRRWQNWGIRMLRVSLSDRVGQALEAKA